MTLESVDRSTAFGMLGEFQGMSREQVAIAVASGNLDPSRLGFGGILGKFQGMNRKQVAIAVASGNLDPHSPTR